METPPRLYTPRFALLLGLQFVFGLGFSSYLLLPKYLTTAFAADADVIGRVMAAGPIAAVAAIPLLASRIDRLSLRTLMVIGALAMLLSSLGFMALRPPGPLMLVLRALQGLGFVAFFTSSTVLASKLAAPERLGQALGLLGAANLLTNALAPALAELVAEHHGWLPVFAGSALSSLLATAGVIVVPAESANAPVQAPALEARALFTPRFLRLMYAGAMVGVSFGTVLTFYQPLALQVGVREVRDLLVGYTVSALFVRIALGQLLDRFQRRRLAIAAFSTYALVVFATAGLQPGWLLTLGLGLGLAHGALWPVLTTMTVEGSLPGKRGALITWFNGSFHVGLTLSTLCFGYLAHALGYRAVMVLGGLGAASGAFMLLRLEAPALLGALGYGEETYR